MEKVCPYSYFVLLSCSHMTTTEMQEQLIKAHTLGAKICIGTRGSEGSTCYDGDQFYTQAPHWKEHVVDTMGAGDAFVSAFLYDFIGPPTDIMPKISLKSSSMRWILLRNTRPIPA